MRTLAHDVIESRYSIDNRWLLCVPVSNCNNLCNDFYCTSLLKLESTVCVVFVMFVYDVEINDFHCIVSHCDSSTPCFKKTSNQSINQSTRIYIAPYVAGESEARTGLG